MHNGRRVKQSMNNMYLFVFGSGAEIKNICIVKYIHHRNILYM